MIRTWNVEALSGYGEALGDRLAVDALTCVPLGAAVGSGGNVPWGSAHRPEWLLFWAGLVVRRGRARHAVDVYTALVHRSVALRRP